MLRLNVITNVKPRPAVRVISRYWLRFIVLVLRITAQAIAYFKALSALPVGTVNAFEVIKSCNMRMVFYPTG